MVFSGIHQDGRKIDFNFDNVDIVGTNPDGIWYSNAIPTADSVSINPGSKSVVAGKWTSVEFALTTPDGLTYAHTLDGGWYKDFANSVKIDMTNLKEFKILKGKKRGTYIINFRSEKT